MNTKAYSIIFLLLVLFACASCEEEWTEEQFAHYISFKAPLDQDGVTPIYVRYKADGITPYKLPIIVSGSTVNDKAMSIKVAVDPDTLANLNIERFQSRTDLFYEELNPNYFSIQESVDINAGEDVSLMNIDFNLSGIDLVDKWILPLTIVDSPTGDYVANPRKNYSKALLRVMPFNDYSGTYSGTALKTYLRGSEDGAAIVKSEIMVYVVDENTVFFYAGTMDEDRIDRRNYKIIARFNEQTKQVELSSDNPDMNLEVIGTPTFTVEETMDATRPYLLHRYITINKIDYHFTDYTSVPNASIDYTVRGSLILERNINTQIPDEDQAIEW